MTTHTPAPAGYIHPDNVRRLEAGETVAFRKKPYQGERAIPVFIGSAPVADERDRNATISKVVGLCNSIPGATTWNAAEFMYDEMHRRAALASAPVAAPSDETLRLAGVIADKIEDGTLFQAGIFSRRDLADKVRAVVRFVQVASAPVAGEAQPVAWREVDRNGHAMTCWYDGNPGVNPVPSQASFSIQRAYAAPQASEAVQAVTFDDWLAKHCDSDDLTAYERELALDAWNAARTVEPLTLPGFDADRLRAIASSGSQTAMSNALMNVARALSAQPGAQKESRDE